VHLRDIIEDLIKDNVQNLENFNWVKQLRYYYDSEMGDVKLIQSIAKLFLSYEYLGNSTRLVVTSLTDRCNLTMTVALQLNLSGNP